MILRYADNVDIFSYRQYGRCAKRNFIPPVPDIAQLTIYVKFGATKPSSFEIWIVNACKYQEAKLVNSGCWLIAYSGSYWYGVFKGLTSTASYQQFLFAVKTSNATYFSDIVEIPNCDELMKLSVCYPNNYNAEDINGAYIGQPDGGFAVSGSPDVIYSHKAWVRMGEVIETSNKVKFVSSRFKNFSTSLTRQWELRSEPVPGWYKDILLAIYFRGNIMINDQEAQVADLNFEDIDVDYWKPYAVLSKEFKGSFGCAPIACLPECVCYEVQLADTFDSQYVAYADNFFGVLNSIVAGSQEISIIDLIIPEFLTLVFDGTAIQISGTPDLEDISPTPYPISFKIVNPCTVIPIAFDVLVKTVLIPPPTGDVDILFDIYPYGGSSEYGLTAQFKHEGVVVFEGGITPGGPSPFTENNALEKFTEYQVQVKGRPGKVAWLRPGNIKLHFDMVTGLSSWVTFTTLDFDTIEISYQ